MTAGRELDALVAEKVIGIPAAWIHDEPNGKMIDVGGRISHIAANARYSTDIAAALTVQQAIEKRGFWMRLDSPFDPTRGGSYWHAGFTPFLTTGWNGIMDHKGTGENAAHAICIAALAVVAAKEATDAKE